MKRSKLSPVLAAPVARQPQDAVAVRGGIDASNGSPWDPRPPFAGVDASGSPWDPGSWRIGSSSCAGAEACGWE